MLLLIEEILQIVDLQVPKAVHTDELPGGSLFHRSVCVAEFRYNEDGTIDTIEKCDGVEGIRE